jgi:hypothetical protein
MGKSCLLSLPVWVVLSALGGVCLAGCGASPVVRVQGKVTVEGKPLPQGVVIFQPDPARNNSSAQEARGAIRADGSYDLLTNGRLGVMPGRYKVCVVAVSKRPTPKGGWTVRPLIPPKYGNPATSGLEVEAGPGKPAGAYDLALQGAGRR